jgi:hypothetical protein
LAGEWAASDGTAILVRSSHGTRGFLTHDVGKEHYRLIGDDDMRQFAWLLSGLMIVALLFVGCGKKSSVNTAPLQSSFKSADSATQSDVDKAVSSIKAGSYSQALSQLQALAKKAKLTPEQQQAIRDVITQVQQQITAMANKAATDAQKTAGDLQKSLPK